MTSFNSLVDAFEARRRLEDADMTLSRARRKLAILKGPQAPHDAARLAAARKVVANAERRVLAAARIEVERAR